MVELRSQGTAAGSQIGSAIGAATPEAQEVLSLDYGSTPPTVTRGVPVRLDDLALTGLRGEQAKDEKGRQFACPSCGRFVSVANIHQEDYRDPSAYYGIGTTTAITCSRCGLVIWPGGWTCGRSSSESTGRFH